MYFPVSILKILCNNYGNNEFSEVEDIYLAHSRKLLLLSLSGALRYLHPVNKEKTEGYYGRGETFPFGENVIEIPAEDVKYESFDCILFQTNKNYLVDQHEILSSSQRQLPRIYLEHDPPWKHPTDARHVVDDPLVQVVHVTHFNRLMWDNHGIRTRVIEHGVTAATVQYSGEIEKGIVVINNLPTRGRLLGLDPSAKR